MLDLFPLKPHDLSWKSARAVVTLAELTVVIGSPRKDGALVIDRHGEATLLFADLNVSEGNVIHADLLRSTENTKLSCAPDNQLFQICDHCREATSCTLYNIVNFKLVKSEGCEEISLARNGCIAQTHLMVMVGAESIDGSIDGQGQTVAVTATDLYNVVIYSMHKGRSRYKGVAPIEVWITKA